MYLWGVWRGVFTKLLTLPRGGRGGNITIILACGANGSSDVGRVEGYDMNCVDGLSDSASQPLVEGHSCLYEIP